MSYIAVAVSGGIDSLFALYSLYEQGHKVIAVHALFLPHCTKAPDDLQDHCKRLQIPLHVLDLRKEFDAKVIEPFIQSYANSKTPNPCAICNATMKFGLLMDSSLQLGADFYATGHYATKCEAEHKSPLSKGIDNTKDQSYFLALTPKHCFEKVIFPLANTKKIDNFNYLQQHGFDVSNKGESQEICFIPNDAYRPFVEQESAQRSIKLPAQGPFYIYDGNVKRQIGVHQGLWQYTEGQRRGLGVAWKEPLYVCSKDSQSNSITLGPASKLALKGCTVDKINLLVDKEYWPQQVFVRVRYRQVEASATITWQGQSLMIEFNDVQSPTACGQVAVIYDKDGSILAGGIITNLF